MSRPPYDQRIARAQDLAAAYPSAAEVLGFYEQLAATQKALYTAFKSTAGALSAVVARGATLCACFDLKTLLPRYPHFLDFVRDAAPPALADAAAQVRGAGAKCWEQLLSAYWNGAPVPACTEGSDEEEVAGSKQFLALGFLQPYAEFLAEQVPPVSTTAAAATCPLCDSEPVVAVLRPEGHGARRALICSLCATEWNYNRLTCPACGETRGDALAVFTSEHFDHMRVDACDTCKHYLKTVDLTKNGLAVPVVDELASLPLTLWARENGYTKLAPNLLGM